MKKLSALFLVLLLIATIVGCANEDVRGDISGNYQSENSEKEESENELSLGKTENNKYENDFLGIGCNLPSDWVFYNDEQIAELNNITTELAGEEFAEAIKNANLIYDMFAMTTDSTCNMNVVMEKIDPILISTIDLEESIKSQFDTIKTSYQNMGYSNIDIKYQKLTVDGKGLDGAKIAAEIQGIKFYAVLFMFKKGSYTANVTITSLVTDKTQDLLDCYYFIK